MRIEMDQGQNVWFHDMAPVCAETLLKLPDMLEADEPEVRRRRLPRVYHEDDEAEAEWRRYGASELQHLFASRVEILRKDLQTLEQEAELTYRIRIPAAHRSAWLSALNGARLSLFIQAGLDPEEMEQEPGTIGDYDKDVSLLRIHLMAYMQELLIEADRAKFGPDIHQKGVEPSSGFDDWDLID